MRDRSIESKIARAMSLMFEDRKRDTSVVSKKSEVHMGLSDDKVPKGEVEMLLWWLASATSSCLSNWLSLMPL